MNKLDVLNTILIVAFGLMIAYCAVMVVREARKPRKPLQPKREEPQEWWE